MDKPSVFDLTTEQQFSKLLQERDIDEMPVEQLRAVTKQMVGLMLAKDNFIKHLMKRELGGELSNVIPFPSSDSEAA